MRSMVVKIKECAVGPNITPGIYRIHSIRLSDRQLTVMRADAVNAVSGMPIENRRLRSHVIELRQILSILGHESHDQSSRHCCRHWHRGLCCYCFFLCIRGNDNGHFALFDAVWEDITRQNLPK